VVHLVDECGREFGPLEFNINESANVTPSAIPTRVDCTEGMGTLGISAYYPPITSVIITAAPAGFPEPLPFDASFNCFEDGFYMDNLPAGPYTLQVTDNCTTHTIYTNIVGYQFTSHEVEVTRHCGSFDLYLAHSSNAYADVYFWLQK